MATLTMIDASKGVSLVARTYRKLNHPALIAESQRLNMPQLLISSEPTEGAEPVRISDAAAFISWLQSTRWGEYIEVDLRCQPQDTQGRSIFVAWIPLCDFEQLASDARDTEFGPLLQQAYDNWVTLTPHEIALEGHRLA